MEQYFLTSAEGNPDFVITPCAEKEKTVQETQDQSHSYLQTRRLTNR